MKNKRQKGMALLLVLVIVALLTSVLTDLAYSTLVDIRLTETFRDSTKAYYLAKGGINAGRMILQEDKNSYDNFDEPWSKGVISYPVGEGSISINITDQGGKLAINELVDGNNPSTVMVDRFYRLLSSLNLDDRANPAELTAALIDWVDTGDTPYDMIRTDNLNIPVEGAESVYYQSLTQPYPSKNGPLETLQELSLIKGFTPAVIKIVSPYLAVNGSQEININTASAEVLMALNPQIDLLTAQKIIEYRQQQPIKTIAQLEEFLDQETYSIFKTLANLKQLGTSSQTYWIESIALVNDGSRRLLAEVDKKLNRLLFFKVN